MATFVVLAGFTDQGIRNVKETISRAEAFKQMAKTSGITVKDLYWTLGRYDVVAVCEAPDINIKGEEIALFNIEGVFFAVQNACTHEEGPLVEGDIEGHEVTCPWHGARFDVRTGEVLCPPAYEDVHRYNVRLIGTDIELEI